MWYNICKGAITMINFVNDLTNLNMSINSFLSFYNNLDIIDNIPKHECNIFKETVIINPVNIIDDILHNMYNLLDNVVTYIHPSICHIYEENHNSYFEIIDQLTSIKNSLYFDENISEKIISFIHNLTIIDFSSTQNSNNKLANIIILPIENDLLYKIDKNPDLLYKISDSEFESVICDLYTKLGFIATHTQLTCDGGKDIIISEENKLGNFLYYVECKHFSSNKPIGVGIMRQFAGTVLSERINGGIIVTSSYFSKQAQDFIKNSNLQYQIKLHDSKYILNLIHELYS